MDIIEQAIGSLVISVLLSIFLMIATDLLFKGVTYNAALLALSLSTLAVFSVFAFRALSSEILQSTALESFINKIFSMKRKEKILSIFTVFVVSMLIVAGVIILTRPQAQSFSEYYILSKNGTAYDIPREFTVGLPDQMIVGIANHEGKEIDYNAEIWLVNYSDIEMAVTVHEMYYLGSVNVTLESMDIDLNDPYVSQFEHMVELNMTISGKLDLFVIFYQGAADPLPEYPLVTSKDYAKTVLASNRIIDCLYNGLSHLSVNIKVFPSESPMYVDGSLNPPQEPRHFQFNESQNISVQINNLQGEDTDYVLEVWIVNFTNMDMAVTVHEMYFVDSYAFSIPFTGRENATMSFITYNLTLVQNQPGNFSIFFLLYKDSGDPFPESPMVQGKNYAFTAASWRIVRCVNNEVQYYQLETVVSA